MGGVKREKKYTPNRYMQRFTEKQKRTNLKRDPSGNWKNKHGLIITQEDRKAFEREVNAVNRKHEKMLRETDKLARRYADTDPATGKKIIVEEGSVQQLRMMYRPSEMIISKRTKNLQRFENKKEFNSYMRELRRINKNPDNYIAERIRLYKRNYAKVLTDVYGEAGEDIARKIKSMNRDEYMKLVTQSDELRIEWVYPVKGEDANDKLNTIRALLGMKEVDTYGEEIYD